MQETQQPLVVEAGSRLLSTQEIETFESLSKEVFNATSRWSTLLKKGIAETVFEEVTEYVPATDTTKEETRTHKVPVYLDAAKKSLKMVQRRFTPETLMAFMLERKKQIDLIKALIAENQKKAKEAQDKAALAKQISQSVSGGA